MERLLNIKEAAAYLNVTEMTIRRWTNQGQLPCYRIGNRRARRFKDSDLTAYLERSSPPKDRRLHPLGIAQLTMPHGAHFTHLSANESEALEVAGHYIREGLIHQETVLVVASDADKIIDSLECIGLKTEAYLLSNKLICNAGQKTPAQQVAFIAQIAAGCDHRLRVFGDMTWTQRMGWHQEELRLLELTPIVTQTPVGALFLCQYRLNAFSASEVMLALETHTHAIYQNKLACSPFYAQPEL
jgi:transcriptional repressor of dcmA and dcmR